MLAAQEPRSAGPNQTIPAPATFDRQRKADLLFQALLKDSAHAFAFLLVFDFVFERIDIDRQPALAEHVMPRVFVTGDEKIRTHTQTLRQPFTKALCFIRSVAVIDIFIGNQIRAAPNRHAVTAPVTTKSPARQLFARVPFALAIMEQPANSEAIAQPR